MVAALFAGAVCAVAPMAPGTATAQAGSPRAFVGDVVQAIQNAADGLTYRVRVTDPDANNGQPQDPFNALAFPLVDPGDALCGIGPCNGGVRLADGDNAVDVDVDVTVTLNGDLVVDLRRIGPADLAKIEVLLDVPGTEQVAVFGYDARQGGTPGTFEARFAFDSTDDRTDLSMSLVSQDPSESLAVIGGLFTEGPVPPGTNLGPIIDPFSASVALGRAALDVSASMSIDRVANTIHGEVHTGAEQVPGSVSVSDTRLGHTRSVTAGIRDLPADVAVDVALPASGQQAQVHYTASSVIGSMDVSATAQDSEARTPDVNARVVAQGIPTDVLVTALPGGTGQPSRVEYHASGSLTRIAAAVSGLTGAVSDAAVAVQGAPADLTVQAGPATGQVDLTTGPGRQIGDLDVKLRRGPLLPQDTLPGSAEGLLVRESFGGLSVHGHIKGLREVHTKQTSGAAGSGFHRTIRSATMVTDPALPDRGFRVRVELPGPNAAEPAETTEAVLSPLPSTVSLTADVTTTGTGATFSTLLTYTAAETAQSFVLNSDVGDRRNLRVALTGVPRNVSACQGASTVCTGTVVRTGGTSLKLQVDNPTRIDLFDCVEGPATGCSPGNAVVFTDVAGLTLTPVGATKGTLSAAVVPPPVQAGQVGQVGQVFFDTDNTPINGHIRTSARAKVTGCQPDPNKLDKTDIVLSDVKAQNRDAIIALDFPDPIFFPCLVTGVHIVRANGQQLASGTMICGQGTNIDVREGIGGNLNAELCTTGP